MASNSSAILGVLIGYFLVGILQYGPLPWKRSVCVFFLVPSREIQSHAKHNEKKKSKFSYKSLSLKRLTDNMGNDDEYEHLPSEF